MNNGYVNVPPVGPVHVRFYDNYVSPRSYSTIGYSYNSSDNSRIVSYDWWYIRVNSPNWSVECRHYEYGVYQIPQVYYNMVSAYYAYTAPKYYYNSIRIRNAYYAYTPAIRTNPMHYIYSEV